jgi:hypothetical protein
MSEFTKEFIAKARQIIAEGTLSVKEMKTGDPVDIQLNMLRRRAKTEHCEYYYLDALDEIERLRAEIKRQQAINKSIAKNVILGAKKGCEERLERLQKRVAEMDARISAYEADDPYLCMRYQPSESSEEI